jgi:RsiW-degrading membrane proteinase PrsW (M82 family)
MLSNPTFLYLATILPPIFLGVIIWKSDKFPEPGKFLVTAFMLGVAIDLPLILLIFISENQIAPLLGLDLQGLDVWEKGGWKEEGVVYPAGELAFMNFFRAAFLEEGIKFALLIFICVRLEALNEPIDAIVYGAAIGLGYAAMENYGYLASPNFENAWTIEMVKARYYPLVMHLGFGVVMGWLLSLNLFYETNRFKRRFMLIISLAIPVIYHGTYNYYSAVDIFPLLTVILIISIVYWARREQLRKITESEEKYKIMNSDVAYTYLASLFLVVAVLISAMIY